MDKTQSNNSESEQILKRKKPWLVIFLLALIFALTASSIWLTTSTSGLKFLLSMVSRVSGGSVQFDHVNGTLSALTIQKISYTSEELQLNVDEFEFAWRPKLLFSRQLTVDLLAANAIEVHTAPTTEKPEEPEEPFKLPENLHLPLSIVLHKLEIGLLQMSTIGEELPDVTITNIAMQLESDTHRHQLQIVSLELDLGKLTGSVRLSPNPPFDLSAQATLLGWLSSSEKNRHEATISIELTGNAEKINGVITGKSAGAQGRGAFEAYPFASMPLTALNLAIERLDPQAFMADLPEANFSIHSNLNGDRDGMLVGDLIVKNSMPKPLDQNGLPIVEIRVQPTISMDEIQLDDILLKLADDAKITGQLSWKITEAIGTANLKVQHLNPAALDTSLQAAKISGTLRLTGDTGTQQGMLNLRDENLALVANFNRTETAVSLEQLKLSHRGSTITGQGQLNLKDAQSFHFNGMLNQFDLSAFMQSPRSNLNATLTVSGELAPQASGNVNFTVTKSQFAQQPVSGKGQITFENSKRIRSDTDLKIGANQLSIKGAFGNKGDRLSLNLAAPALAQLGLGLKGDLNTQLILAETLDSPRLFIDSNTKNLVINNSHRLSDFIIKGNLHESAVALDIKMASYRQDTEDSENYLENLTISVAGNKAQHTLNIETSLPKESLFAFQTTGRLDLPPDNPENFKWKGEIKKLVASGLLPFSLLNQPELNISPNKVSLEPTRIAVAEGEINILDANWTPQQWSTRGTLANITLRPIDSRLQNVEPLQMGGDWDITARRQLTGRLRLAREKGDVVLSLEESPIRLGLQQLQLAAHVEQGNVMADLVIRGDKIGETLASATLPLITKDGGWQIAHELPLSGRLNANIADLSWIGPIAGSNLKSDGKLSLQVDLTGTFNQPRVNGVMLGEELAIALLDQGIDLQQGNLNVKFDQTSLKINTLTFVAPHHDPPDDPILSKVKLPKESGKLTVTGAVDYHDQRSNLTIEIDHLPLSQLPNRWIIASGDGKASLENDQLTIGGKIIADAGFILQPEAGQPQLSDDIVIIGQTPPPENAEDLLITLDATLDLGKHFYLRASGLEGRLDGKLNLTSKPEEPLSAIGTISTRDTSFNAYGQNLSVQRGIVSFDGPLDDPGLNVLAVRPNLAVEAGVEVTGTVRKPIIMLVSTPTVPDAEKLSWIVLGRPPDASGVDTSLLLTAASSILAGQSGGGVMDQIGQTLGVDEFTIKQQATPDVSGRALGGQIGVIGKRLSSRAYLSYERGLTTAAAGITKLTYSLTRNINIVTRAGDDNAIDLYYNFHFD